MEILLIIFIVKSLQKEKNSTNLLLGPLICLQSPQSDSTSWTLTLIGGQLGAHEKSRLRNNEVVQPHNRGQGSRLEGTIKKVWRFDATFALIIRLWSFKFGGIKKTDLKVIFR